MKFFLTIISFCFFFTVSTKATNVIIIESRSYYTGQGFGCDSAWLRVCISLGDTATIMPQVTLDSTNWFGATDILIISNSLITLSDTAVNTIQSYVQQGGRAYIQGEYSASYPGNMAFSTIVGALGGSFFWTGTTDGNLAPMNVLGSLSSTPNAVTPLTYFWYGCAGTGGGGNSHIEPFLNYGCQYFGFIFCVPGNSAARVITTSDQDWEATATSIPLMENILLNLASPSYACVTTGSGGLGIDLGPDTAICNGQQLTLNAATSGAISYLWSTGATTDTISVSAAGTYWVNVLTSSCSGSDTIRINQSSPTVTISADKNTFCTGDSAQICTTGSFASYQWNKGGSAGCMETGLAGNYYVTVADANGCSAVSNQVAINVNPVPSVTIVADKNTFCTGDSAQICATGGFTGYQWNISGSSNCIAASQRGNYYVTVTDANGCSAASNQVAISVNPAPSVTIVADKNIFCNGDSARVCATSGFTAYQWNVNDSEACIQVNEAGNYYVVVTDTDGCKAESNHLAIDVYPVPPVSITVTGDTLFSFGAVSYQWYFGDTAITGATGQTYIARRPGNYSIRIIDTYGCATFSDPVTITMNGTNELKEEGVLLYPNPNSAGRWPLAVGDEWIGSKIEVYDQSNQIVFKSTIPASSAGGRNLQSEISLSVSRGVYFLHIFSADLSTTRKLVKL